MIKNILLQYIKQDGRGFYTTILLRTAISAILSVIAYRTIPLGGVGVYAILMGLFSVQTAIGDTYLGRIKNNIIGIISIIVVIFITTFTSSIGLPYLQVIYLCVLSAVTVYGFSTHKWYASIILYCAIFNIISFGLSLNEPGFIQNTFYAAIIGGICALISTLVTPFSSIAWPSLIKKAFLREVVNFTKTQNQIGFFKDFSSISLKNKNKILHYHYSMIKLVNELKNPYPDFYITASRLVDNLIMLSYWPSQSLSNDDISHEMKQMTIVSFQLVGQLFDHQDSLPELQKMQGKCNDYIEQYPKRKSLIVSYIKAVLDESQQLISLR